MILKNGVRTVGLAEDRFVKIDFCILRAIRFAARFESELETKLI
jgi:tRNA nucleotidyltransferase/poly(A) polymerase